MWAVKRRRTAFLDAFGSSLTPEIKDTVSYMKCQY
jgi:hypothetical protein